jgi:hypothetical protein
MGVQVSVMVIACTALLNRKKGSALVLPSCCWIPIVRRLQETFGWGPEIFPYIPGDPAEDLSRNEQDNEGCMAMFLNGEIGSGNGQIIKDNSFLICLNAHHEAVEFQLPNLDGSQCELVLNTVEAEGFLGQAVKLGKNLEFTPRSLCLPQTSD